MLATASGGVDFLQQRRGAQHVEGVVHRAAVRRAVSIDQDGVIEECELASGISARAAPGYCTFASSLDGGGMVLCIHLDGSLGEHLAAVLVPDALAALPYIGRVATIVTEWVPTVLLVGLCVGAYLEGR